MDKIITVLGYKKIITEMSDAPDCCVFDILSLKAQGYKTHNSFHNASYEMKIHLRSYI